MTKIINMNDEKSVFLSKISELNHDETIDESDDKLNDSNINVSKLNLLKKNLLLISIITSVVLGISAGFLLRQFFSFDERTIAFFGFPGSIFLRLIKLFIMPLIAFR
jgi:L-cystine uptake protein TcyP (sodium:dicarboxylate symporter family)